MGHVADGRREDVWYRCGRRPPFQERICQRPLESRARLDIRQSGTARTEGPQQRRGRRRRRRPSSRASSRRRPTGWMETRRRRRRPARVRKRRARDAATGTVLRDAAATGARATRRARALASARTILARTTISLGFSVSSDIIDNAQLSPRHGALLGVLHRGG